MNKELLEVLQQQENQIGLLKKFIWDISENPELLKDQSLMNILIDNDFGKCTDLTISKYTATKIKELEQRLFSTSEMLDMSRKVINKYDLLTGHDREVYNRTVDDHLCQWVDSNGNVVESQEG